MTNRFGEAAEKRFEEQQAILDAAKERIKETQKVEEKVHVNESAKGSKEAEGRKSDNRKASGSKSTVKKKSQVSKKMEDNQAAIMFYLPEDVKIDLAVYAKKHKVAVAEILRELVIEKIYS